MSEPSAPPPLVAWTDGVGAFLLLSAERMTLGGPTGGAEVRLSADLPGVQATIMRDGEGHLIEAAGGVLVVPSHVSTAGGRAAARVVAGRGALNNGDELVLFREGSEVGGGVRLRFARPNPLTATAVLTVLGDRCTTPRYDGVILLAEACVFGPGADAHIRCRDADSPVLLFRRGDELWVRSDGPVTVNGTATTGAMVATAGDHVAGPGVSFRLGAT